METLGHADSSYALNSDGSKGTLKISRTIDIDG